MIYDLIVIGSGSVGAAAGWYATKAGLKVLTIDKAHPPHDEGSHHGETRLIRHAYGSGVSYVPMVLRAQQLWYELESLAGERIMHRCGLINIGPEKHKFIRNCIECSKHYQLPVEILTPQAVMQRWPQIKVPDGLIGVYESNSGYLKCEVAIKHWLRLAKEAGCTQLFNCPVRAVSRDGEMQRVETDSGVYLGRKVLFSSGTWLPKLLPELPVGFVIFQANGSNFYGFPAKKTVLKIGKHNGGQPINNPEERTPFGSFAEDEAEVRDALHQFFPGTGECIYGKACTYDITPDEDFIIDTQPGEPNRLIISGLSGHGFKFASVLGEIAAAFAQNKPMPFDLSPFSLSRFKSHL